MTRADVYVIIAGAIMLAIFIVAAKHAKSITDYKLCLLHDGDNCAIVKCLDSADKEKCYQIFGEKNEH